MMAAVASTAQMRDLLIFYSSKIYSASRKIKFLFLAESFSAESIFLYQGYYL